MTIPVQGLAAYFSVFDFEISMGDLPLRNMVKHLVIFLTNDTHKSYKNHFLLCFAFFNKAFHSRGSLSFLQMISRFAFFNFSPWPPPGCSSAPTKRKILVQYLSQKTCTCNFFISLGETLAVTSAIILWWTFFLFLTRTDPFADQQGFCAFYLRLLPIQSQNSSEHPTYSKTCTSISTNMSSQWKFWSCFSWGKNIAGKYLAIRNWQLIPGQIDAASYQL